MIVCDGYHEDENPTKILFQQQFNQCWVKKSDIRSLQPLGIHEGRKFIRIVIPEEVANTLELQGILD
jgi:hypothetical protein